MGVDCSTPRLDKVFSFPLRCFHLAADFIPVCFSHTRSQAIPTVTVFIQTLTVFRFENDQDWYLENEEYFPEGL